MFRFNFTNKRAFFQTLLASPNGTFDIPVPMQLDRPVRPNDQLGTGSLGGLDPAQNTVNNKTWTLVLNTIGETGGVSGRQTAVQLTAAQCDVDGCLHPKVSALPSTYSAWSSPYTWPSGVVPQPGDDVVVAYNMAVEMDISPPLLGNLRIDGALRFKNDSAKTLMASTIAVFGCGDLERCLLLSGVQSGFVLGGLIYVFILVSLPVTWR